MCNIKDQLRVFWNDVQSCVAEMNGANYTSDEIVISLLKSRLVVLHQKYYDNRLFDKIPVPSIRFTDGVLSVLYSPLAISKALGDWIAVAEYEKYWRELNGR